VVDDTHPGSLQEHHRPTRVTAMPALSADVDNGSSDACGLASRASAEQFHLRQCRPEHGHPDVTDNTQRLDCSST